MFKSLKNKLFAAGAAVLGSASLASADVTVTGDSMTGSIDMSLFFSAAGIILTALFSVWALKKVIALVR